MADDSDDDFPVNTTSGGQTPARPQNVTPIISPDQGDMLKHLQMLFGRAQHGRIEITAIHADKSVRRSPQTRFFAADQFEDAAEFADKTNREPGWNVYVGAALRHDLVFPGQAADDTDFLETYAVWADADDGDQVTRSGVRCRELLMTPPMVVVTGRTPSTRAQLWWPLETPLRDIDMLRSTLRGISTVLGTDTRVCTGKQLMRLGGTLNWPKKEDRTLELVKVVIPKSAATFEFLIEQVHRAFPPLTQSPPGEIGDIEVKPTGSLGLTEKVMDGRELYAFRLIRANLREWIGTTGSAPSADELYRQVAPIYLAKADQVRPGRGPEFLKQKCAEAVRSFDAGQIPGAENLEAAVLSWTNKHPVPVEEQFEDEFEDQPFRASDLKGEPPVRQWIVQDWIVQGAVNSLYGDGGLGKTLLAQQLACSVSIGAPWLGLETISGPVLAVLCEDDKDELHRRHASIKTAMGHPIGNPFHDVWLWPRVGEDNVLVRWGADAKPALGAFSAQLVKTIERLTPSLVILDTLADFYGGNEIDRVQVNYFVKVVLAGLIKRQPTPLTILLLGHPSVSGQADKRGFSGSTAWNNSVRSRMYLTRPEEGDSDERRLTRGKANYAASGDETAMKLVYRDGVLHALNDAEDGDSMLWAAKKEATNLVDKAWRQGNPFTGKKDHPRYIYKALPPQMGQAGFGPEITRQAVREAVEDGAIKVSASDGKRGYKSA